jgi:hypothetical protein
MFGDEEIERAWWLNDGVVTRERMKEAKGWEEREEGANLPYLPISRFAQLL